MFFVQMVYVYFVVEEVVDGVDIGGQIGEIEEDVVVLEDFGEVVGDGEGLEVEVQVVSDGDVVFVDYGDVGVVVWRVGVSIGRGRVIGD